MESGEILELSCNCNFLLEISQIHIIGFCLRISKVYKLDLPLFHVNKEICYFIHFHNFKNE
jgi:hypothetical protein